MALWPFDWYLKYTPPGWLATWITNKIADSEKLGQYITPPEGSVGSTPAQVAQARAHLLYGAAIFGGAVAAPTLYAIYKSQGRKRKRQWTDSELRIGQSLENTSNAMTGLMMTALAAPAIATASAYIVVQKLEDGQIIRKSLGDAAQTLLAVQAAGPAISGIGGIVKSAFTKVK